MAKEVKQIEFAQDTEERRRWFRAASFSHPAKMVLGLQIYLIEHYTKVGETILDPMGGSGTALVGCALGRNVICVELEKKFVKMIEANWEKIKSLGPMLGYKMGQATILQGDARQLPELLADKCVFSPPFAGSRIESDGDNKTDKYGHYEHGGLKCDIPETNGQISNLPYGQIDKIVTSPPYAEALDRDERKHSDGRVAEMLKRSYLKSTQGRTEGQIGNLPYKADAVITSPPYEETISGKELRQSEKLIGRQSGKHKWGNHLRLGDSQLHTYSAAGNNIGNLKSDNYLEAMAQVYHQCHRVLKDGGLLCLVVKNFIRDKKIVRLDSDTIKLCEQAGFVLKERLKRKLTQQSFWRIIYAQRFPDAPKIEFEDVLIFTKEIKMNEKKCKSCGTIEGEFGEDDLCIACYEAAKDAYESEHQEG